MPEVQDISTWTYEKRLDQARKDAVRYAAICYLPLEPQSNKPDIVAPGEPGSWQDWQAWWYSGTQPANRCATIEIKGKMAYYDVAPPTNAEIASMKLEAQKQAKIGATKGQVRPRDYVRY